MERAAEQRYLDGLSLATGPERRTTGAIYLLGYAAEMTLKAAYYRIRGVGPLDDLSPELRGMRSRARYLGFPWGSGRSRHDVEDLAGLLIFERQARRIGLDPYFSVILQGHVRVITEHWSEQLRYKEEVASEAEVTEFFRSVDWVISNYTLLWS